LLIVLAIEIFGLFPPGPGRRIALLLRRPTPAGQPLALERPG